MIPKGLFTQIGMVIVAVAIIVTYVQPAFSEIGEVQDQIGVYKTEREKVSSVNNQLDELVSRLDSISNDDEKRLLTYLPDQIDEINIQRDLLLIAKQAEVLVKGSNYTGESSETRTVTPGEPQNIPTAHGFNISIEGTFDQIKNFFSLMEQNHYPLEVESVNIAGREGDFLEAEISFVTYTYKPKDGNKIVKF